MTTPDVEAQEARALDRAIDAARRGAAPPASRPRDLDALTALLVVHAAAVRGVVPLPAAPAPRPLPPRVFPVGLVVVAALLVGVVLGGRLLFPAPATGPLRMPPAMVAMAMAMPMTYPEPEVVAAPVAPSLPAPVAAPVVVSTAAIAVARPFRVVSVGRVEVPVRAAPAPDAATVMLAVDGMAAQVTGERVADAAGDGWYPVQIGTIRGFVRVESLREVRAP